MKGSTVRGAADVSASPPLAYSTDGFSWASFVGIPYKRLGRTLAGVDCWGLVRCVLLKAGIELPVYGAFDCGPSALEPIEVEKASGEWTPVSLEDSRPLDLVIMRSPVKVDGHWINLPVHIGIVALGGMVLHVHEDTASVLQPIEVLRHRIVGVFRHKRF